MLTLLTGAALSILFASSDVRAADGSDLPYRPDLAEASVAGPVEP